MTFLPYSNTVKNNIQKRMNVLLKNNSQMVSDGNRHIGKLYKQFDKSFTGGKYIRGILVVLGFSLVQKKINPEIFTIAAAYEILHTSLLTLDDVIDKSPLRRGKPSMWKIVGKDQAILLSNKGFFLANHSIVESGFDEKIKIQATSLFSRIVLRTLQGEMLDVVCSKNKRKKEQDVLRIQSLKTAYYSISGPLLLGALLAGGDKKLLTILEKFGEYLGIAFQIQDDILGVFGSEKQIGKSITSDIEENKNTLLITHALAHATKQQKEKLQNLYGSKINSQQLTEIRQIFEQTESLSYSQKKTHIYAEKAKKIIPLVTQNKDNQNLLSEFVDFVVKRKK